MAMEREYNPRAGGVIPVEREKQNTHNPEKATAPASEAVADRVTCRAGDASCATAHAATIKRATSSQPGRAGQALLQLQRQYGNRYVERVLAISREQAAEQEPAGHVETAIQKKRGGGQSLDNGVRAQMEGALGADLGGVRIHTDAQSDGLNRKLSARAFTTGQDIFFSHGAYQPGSSTGRELIAHELTHVVQQGSDQVRRAMTVSQPGDPHEVEAEATARAIVQSETKPGAGLQRQPESHHKDEEEEKKKHAHAMKADRAFSAGLSDGPAGL